MKTNKIEKIVIQKPAQEGLRIEFSCRNESGADSTLKVFDTLKKFALTSSARDLDASSNEGKVDVEEWFNINTALLLTYDDEKNKIVFMEKASKTPGAAINMLPSLLLRDWNVIDPLQKDLFETFLEHHSIMKTLSSAASKVDPNEVSWIRSTFNI
jgi:hypothetical protein